MTQDKTRDKILEVATTIFGKKGFRQATVDEIARSANKAKGSVYYYFKSKEELFIAVVKNELDTVKYELTQIAQEDDDSVSKLKKYMNARIQLLVPAFNYHETLRSDVTDPIDFVESVKNEFYFYDIEQVKIILKEGIENESFRDIDCTFVAELIEMVMRGLEIPFLLQNIHVEMQPRSEELFTILLDGLLK